MLKRATLRYEQNPGTYVTVLVCLCGTRCRFSANAPWGKNGRPECRKHARELNAKIKEAGWKECVSEEFDMCAKCNGAEQALALRRANRMAKALSAPSKLFS